MIQIRSNSAASVVAAAALLLLTGAAIVFPGGFVIAEIIAAIGDAPQALAMDARDLRLLALTVAVAALVAILATGVALPAAWSTRTWRGPGLVLMLIPMLLPSYLAYAGWGLVRAPGTWLGDWLMSRGGDGPNLAPVAAGRVLAVMGLTLWAWPLAWLLLAVRIRMLDPAALDALRLEPVARWRRSLVILGMIRPGVLAALGAVFLVMLGSAVPFHVAQLDTYAIAIWRALDETPRGRHGLVWIRAWPLLLIALLAAVVITRAVMSPPSGRGERLLRVKGDWPAWVWPALLWGLSVLAPLALFVDSLGAVRPIATFWRISAGSILSSLTLAMAVAGLGATIGALMWYLASAFGGVRRPGAAGAWPGPLLWVVLVLFLASGLAPGILVGSALARAYGSVGVLAVISDSWGLLALGHLARFGFIPALVGIYLARSEPPELRDLRLLEAGPSLLGWLRTAAAPAAGRVGLLAGVSLGVGLLSFHEIEATVMLQPPTGISGGGSFAWRMLQNLHFARLEELSAGVIIVAAGGLAVGAAILGLAALGARRSPQAR